MKIPQSIYKFVRDRKGNPRGVILALPIWSVNKFQISFGWSYTNTKVDRFDKVKGIEIAKGRAAIASRVRMPHDVGMAMVDFMKRAERYYKDAYILKNTVSF